MSIIHKLIPQKPFSFQALNQQLAADASIQIEQRSETVFYYWLVNESTRGMDVTIENDYIELRNTILSNEADYRLTNRIAADIATLTNALILDEEDEPVTADVLFTARQVEINEINDCNTIHAISKENEEIAIYGPVRKVYFGKTTRQQFEAYGEEERKEKMFALIMRVQYQLPNIAMGNILEVSNGEDTKIMKLLCSHTEYIIEKYDYVMLHKPTEEVLIITNKTLNSILPGSWKRMDEFTIVAPALNDDEWNRLVAAAEPFNEYANFLNSRK